MVRVRFAPSPTGYLHLGSARTALFNWLFARHENGKFILRVEDTDVQRSKSVFLDEILESLKWLGLSWDEGPYFQTKRLDLYRNYAERLVKSGNAYYVEGQESAKQSEASPSGTRECEAKRSLPEGDNGQGKAIKFKVPPRIVKINDAVHGEIEFDNTLLGELVIMKSDGFPTYNFACAVDDSEMGITHVIRGDDHISNTPKQFALDDALGINPPVFVHIPLILGPDRSKLSKRHGAVSIREYREKGYLPEAMVNFLSLLGWSPKANKEIFSTEETVRSFTLEGINRTNAVFDMAKLNWMNGQYIKKEAPEKVLELAIPQLIEKKLIEKDYDKEYLSKLVKVFQPRIKTIDDLLDGAGFVFEEKFPYDETALDAYIRQPGVKDKLLKLSERLDALDIFDEKSAEEATRNLAGELGVEAAQLIHPARVALTGKSVSPGLFEVMALLGKDRCVKRLAAAAKLA